MHSALKSSAWAVFSSLSHGQRRQRTATVHMWQEPGDKRDGSLLFPHKTDVHTARQAVTMFPERLGIARDPTLTAEM